MAIDLDPERRPVWEPLRQGCQSVNSQERNSKDHRLVAKLKV